MILAIGVGAPVTQTAQGERGEESETGDDGVCEAKAGDDQEGDSDEGDWDDPLLSEENIGEFSMASMEPPKRVIRIVGLGKSSSRLQYSHWTFKDEDVSKTLIELRMTMMKYHETLQ
ncbi:hypothetical protein BGZ99_006631 [Dissophora globulifera]|uniref:Uncharacterized protein n=1 Tax=Dissophora globulifera TaxID=979702 RepID=A0A9P6RCY4_9FUNG|nr:hypothetical protein BGZ99_006631 [Dissophora globulifera]